MLRLFVPPSAQPLLFPLALLLLLGALAAPALAGGHGNRHGASEETGLQIITDRAGELPVASERDQADAPQGAQLSMVAPAPDAFFLPLPANLSPEKRKAALAVIAEAEPRLTELHRQMSDTLLELHNLSFAEDTPPEELSILGRKLVVTRNAILVELKTLCKKLEHQAGFNPGWGSQRTCAFRHPRDCEHQNAPAKSGH